MRKYKTLNTLCEKYFTFWYTGGFIANSLAIINDALHQFFDLSSLVMSLVATWIARWKPNEKKSFGYYRAGKYFRDICQFQSSSVSITLQRGNCVCLNRCKQNDRLGSFTLEVECLLGCKVGSNLQWCQFAIYRLDCDYSLNSSNGMAPLPTLQTRTVRSRLS